MKVLLVEPNYYTRYPPLGLLKLGSYHKLRGDRVELVKGTKPPSLTPDLIYITSLFTWNWREVWEAVAYYKRFLFPKAHVVLGGLYASLMPDHASQSGADEIRTGIVSEAEDLLPDYSLLPHWEGMRNWDGSILFSSRGCNRCCSFCAVPFLEGRINRALRSVKHLIWPTHTRIILWDNNFLQSPYWRDILEEIAALRTYKGEQFKLDFNQGLDSRMITEKAAELISRLRLDSGDGKIKIRLAYDSRSQAKSLERAIQRLSSHGIKRKQIMVYVLYNFKDDPQDFFLRVKDVLLWGCVAYPMRYQPISGEHALKKDSYVDPGWDSQRLEWVQKFRRLAGYAGALPPYRALVERFSKAEDFDQVFQPWNPGSGKGTKSWFWKPRN